MAANDEDESFGPTTIRRAAEALDAAEQQHVEKHGAPPSEMKRQSLAKRILSLIRLGGSPQKVAEQAIKDVDNR
ncbi:MAG: hypothetical protein KJ587_00700 [Alphaproteobacteria bacterium]|nr:hypothetical protein [Alphaproteobacteria bacterium]